MKRVNLYIHDMLKRGASHTLIKHNLLHKGHSLDEVNSAIKNFGRKKMRNFFNKITVLAVLLCFFFFMIYLSITTGSELAYVLSGFFPSFLSLLFMILVLEHFIELRKFIWFIPLPFILLFFYIGYILNLPIFSGMEKNELIVLNTILSYTFVAILNFIGLPSGENFVETLPVENKSAGEYIFSIKEKCEGINRAIGRVFKDKSGATIELRNKIKINKTLYTELSLLLDEDLTSNKDKAIMLIESIEESLKNLLKNHIDFLGYVQYSGVNARREDTILDILIRNDKDPVQRYYDGALEFCYKAKSWMRGF